MACAPSHIGCMRRRPGSGDDVEPVALRRVEADEQKRIACLDWIIQRVQSLLGAARTCCGLQGHVATVVRRATADDG